MLKRLAILFFLTFAPIGLLKIPIGRSNSPKEHVAKQEGTRKGQEQPKAQSNNNSSPYPASSTPQPAAPTCDEDCQQGRQNIAIQNRLFWVTVGLAVVGFLQVCGMIWQAILLRQTRGDVHRQANTMERQLVDAQDSGRHTETLAQQAVRQSDLTQRQLNLANRPWIAIDSVKASSNLEFKDDGSAYIFFSYQIRNVGHSVAHHVLPWIEPAISGVNDLVEAKTRISDLLKKQTDSPYYHGKVIFPGQIISDRYPIGISPEVLARALENSPFSDKGHQIKGFGIELFICFDYQSTIDSDHHQTHDMFLLAHQGSGLFLPSRKLYQAEGFTLMPKGMGAYAD